MALYISIVAPADAWCVLPFPEQKVQVALRVLTKSTGRPACPNKSQAVFMRTETTYSQEAT